MEMTTYDFYTKTYYGDSIDESLFPKWESRAEDKLNMLTCGNITEKALKEYNLPIQKSVCALADLLFELDKATKTATAKDESNVKSKSSGGESITYAENQTLVGKVLSDKAAQNRLVYDIVAEYLTGTGLLYAGV